MTAEMVGDRQVGGDFVLVTVGGVQQVVALDADSMGTLPADPAQADLRGWHRAANELPWRVRVSREVLTPHVRAYHADEKKTTPPAEYLGVGAKTAAGYGYLRRTDGDQP
jgi:hypothetical protein